MGDKAPDTIPIANTTKHVARGNGWCFYQAVLESAEGAPGKSDDESLALATVLVGVLGELCTQYAAALREAAEKDQAERSAAITAVAGRCEGGPGGGGETGGHGGGRGLWLMGGGGRWCWFACVVLVCTLWLMVFWCTLWLMGW